MHPNHSLPPFTPPSSPLTLLLSRFTAVLFYLEKSRTVKQHKPSNNNTMQ